MGHYQSVDICHIGFWLAPCIARFLDNIAISAGSVSFMYRFVPFNVYSELVILPLVLTILRHFHTFLLVLM